MLVASIVLGLIALFLLWRFIQAQRDEFIRTFSLPPGLYEKLRQKHPHLSQKDCELVGHALRQFFHAYLRSGKQHVSMPSQVVDDLWHEFILYTRNYSSFCRRAFGGFLHHTPAAVMGKSTNSNMGLRRCWWQACRDEHINPQRPLRLPLLFAIDRKLFIKDGFLYVLDCGSAVEAGKLAGTGLPVYCAADLKPLQGKKDRGGASGCGGGSSCIGDSGGGHGCSGSGCSGGCGGGD